MIVFGVKYCDECQSVICPGEKFLQLKKNAAADSGPENSVHFHEYDGKRCFTGYLERRLGATAISRTGRAA